MSIVPDRSTANWLIVSEDQIILDTASSIREAREKMERLSEP